MSCLSYMTQIGIDCVRTIPCASAAAHVLMQLTMDSRTTCCQHSFLLDLATARTVQYRCSAAPTNLVD